MGRQRRASGAELASGGGHDGGGSLRWLLTYADMITLLMAFFIMLYSMSILNTNKFNQVAISIKSGFGGAVKGQGASILGLNGQLNIRPSPVEGQNTGISTQAVNSLQKVIKEHNLGQAVRLREDERGIIVSLLTDKIVFGRGRVELSSQSKRLLDPVADVLKSMPNLLSVEGHTCDLRVVSDIYPTNWELSSARACSVVRYLIEEKGVPADRLSVSGYAQYKPIVPNTSEANRLQNRRVDIVVLRTAVQ